MQSHLSRTKSDLFRPFQYVHHYQDAKVELERYKVFTSNKYTKWIHNIHLHFTQHHHLMFPSHPIKLSVKKIYFREYQHYSPSFLNNIVLIIVRFISRRVYVLTQFKYCWCFCSCSECEGTDVCLNKQKLKHLVWGRKRDGGVNT